MNIDATKDESVRQTLLMLVAHIRYKDAITREGLLQDLTKLLSGTHPGQILCPEAKAVFDLGGHECVRGAATTANTGC